MHDIPIDLIPLAFYIVARHSRVFVHVELARHSSVFVRIELWFRDAHTPTDDRDGDA